jgi:hypothetical protein
MSRETILLVGNSLYIGIDLSYPNANNVPNITRYKNILLNELINYDVLYQMSIVLSYLNNNKVESYVDTTYYDKGLLSSQYEELVNYIITNVNYNISDISDKVGTYIRLWYLLIEFKVPGYEDIEYAIFQPELRDILNIVVGSDMIQYINEEEDFDFKNVVFIKFHKGNILYEKVEYDVRYSKQYGTMVKNGYANFKLKNNLKPDIMVIGINK